MADSNLLGRILIGSFPNYLSDEVCLSKDFVADLPEVWNLTIID